MRKISRVLLTTSALALSACGGGGGGGGSTTPAPGGGGGGGGTPINYDTAEYRANPGLAIINAIKAYENGITGLGVMVAVVDSGVDVDNDELTGKISPLSRDMFTSRNNVDDEDGHGTAVSGIIAADRDNMNTHGVAFDSTILALRTDDPGSCASADGCSFYDNDIAAAINYAVAQGVKVINISLGGTPANTLLQNALDAATQAGTIVIISAGNDGAADPEGFSMFAADPRARGLVIIAGSVDTSSVVSSFSNRAGIGQDYYLMAPGEDVRTTYINSDQVIVGGTSFAAPHIAGAIALIKQAFPSLTPTQIVQLLSDTATDLGDPGIDAIYGKGLINIEEAFRAQGVLSLVVQFVDGHHETPLDNGQVQFGSAWGDTLTNGSSEFMTGMIFDKYHRAYKVDLASKLSMRPSAFDPLSAIDRFGKWGSQSLHLSENRELRYTVSRSSDTVRYEALVNGDTSQSEDFRDVKMSFRQYFSDTSSFDIAYGLGADTFLKEISAVDGLTNGSVMNIAGSNAFLDPQSDRWMASYRQVLSNGMHWTVGLVDEKVNPPADFKPTTSESRRLMVAGYLGQQFETTKFGVTFGVKDEENTVLDSWSTDGLSLGEGARTAFLGGEAAWDLGYGVHMFGSYMHGLTDVDTTERSVFKDYSTIQTNHFTVGMALKDVPKLGGDFTFTVTQPLRLEGGTVSISQATDWDYLEEVVEFTSYDVGLAPSGRELDLELTYGATLPGGLSLTGNLIHQKNPGHRAGSDSVTTLLFRARMDF